MRVITRCQDIQLVTSNVKPVGKAASYGEGSLQAQVYREQDCRRYEHSKAVVRAIGPMVSNVGKAPISISSQIQYHCEAFCEAINGVNS